MVIFHSYVSLPEGTRVPYFQTNPDAVNCPPNNHGENATLVDVVPLWYFLNCPRHYRVGPGFHQQKTPSDIYF